MLNHIQLDPKSISYEGIRGGIINVKIEVEKRKAIEDFLEREKKFNIEDYNRKVIKIYNFVLDNYFYKVQEKPISSDCRFIELENKSEYYKNQLD